jgi:hypothetical protein
MRKLHICTPGDADCIEFPISDRKAKDLIRRGLLQDAGDLVGMTGQRFHQSAIGELLLGIHEGQLEERKAALVTETEAVVEHAEETLEQTGGDEGIDLGDGRMLGDLTMLDKATGQQHDLSKYLSRNEVIEVVKRIVARKFTEAEADAILERIRSANAKPAETPDPDLLDVSTMPEPEAMQDATSPAQVRRDDPGYAEDGYASALASDPDFREVEDAPKPLKEFRMIDVVSIVLARRIPFAREKDCVELVEWLMGSKWDNVSQFLSDAKQCAIYLDGLFDIRGLTAGVPDHEISMRYDGSPAVLTKGSVQRIKVERPNPFDALVAALIMGIIIR